jgi:hypothetical protein
MGAALYVGDAMRRDETTARIRMRRTEGASDYAIGGLRSGASTAAPPLGGAIMKTLVAGIDSAGGIASASVSHACMHAQALPQHGQSAP